MNECIKLLEKMNIKSSIVVGCSGGPDSMYLMNILVKHGYNVVCAHVHHGLRKESDNEALIVEEYAKKLNIPFEICYLNLSKQNEENFRNERYKFYKNIAKKYNTKYIATAHHGDDLIETILMRIVRGSNLKGYAGFSVYNKSDNYIFLKPLIYLTKKEITDYCDKEHIPYVMDMSNFDLKYSRNRYRHKILPVLKEENSNVHKKFYQFSNKIYAAYEYICKEVDAFLEKNYYNNSLKLTDFLSMNNFLQEAIIEKILSNIYEDNINKISTNHVNSVIENINRGKNFSISLPLGIIVNREYEFLYFVKKNNYKDDFDNIFNNKYETDEYGIYKIASSNDKSNNTIRLNTSQISLPLHIRSQNEGDIIRVKNMGGSKKINKIFIDCKIPKSLRNNYPIVVDNNNTVLWIPGLKKSEFDIDVSKKYDIILKYIKKGKN